MIGVRHRGAIPKRRRAPPEAPASRGFLADAMRDALVPKRLPREPPELIRVAPVHLVQPELVVEQFMFENARLDLLRRVALPPAPPRGPGPAPAAQQGDAHADLGTPHAADVLLDHEEPRAARHARRPHEGQGRGPPPRLAEGGRA